MEKEAFIELGNKIMFPLFSRRYGMCFRLDNKVTKKTTKHNNDDDKDIKKRYD